ncbi:hypothetical protein OROMI_022092 [Orobanche minor]
MRRNCNLELQLVTPSVFSNSADYYNGRCNSMSEEGGSPNEKQPLTIFYNGRVASCDATEQQWLGRSYFLQVEKRKRNQTVRGQEDLTHHAHNFLQIHLFASQQQVLVSP